MRVLATGRAPLGVAGEVVWHVSGLELPTQDDETDAARTLDVAAPRLFVERARAVVPDFAPSRRAATLVAEICRRLDGLPLAIELAASRLRTMSLQDIHDRLEDSLALLVGGSPSSVARHQTLVKALQWSWAMLTEQERITFGRLSVFAGGWTLMILGLTARALADWERGRAFVQESIDLFDRAGEPVWAALAHAELGYHALAQGKLDDAETQYELARRSWDHVSPRLGSWTSYLRGQTRTARTLAETSLARYRAREDEQGMLESLVDLSHIATDSGDPETARLHLKECLALVQRRGWFFNMRALEATAGLLATVGLSSDALRVAAAAEHVRRSIGAPIAGSEQQLLDRRLAHAYAALDGGRAAAALSEGRALTGDQLLAEAHRVLELLDHKLRERVARTPYQLTQRELEVLRLLTAGKSNQAIAVELVLSTRTVSRHLESIFRKLGVTSRTAAAATALRSGLA
jgi:predicted ATPase/DNA-binding CsgD family transcriptional regulator